MKYIVSKIRFEVDGRCRGISIRASEVSREDEVRLQPTEKCLSGKLQEGSQRASCGARQTRLNASPSRPSFHIT